MDIPLLQVSPISGTRKAPGNWTWFDRNQSFKMLETAIRVMLPYGDMLFKKNSWNWGGNLYCDIQFLRSIFFRRKQVGPRKKYCSCRSSPFLFVFPLKPLVHPSCLYSCCILITAIILNLQYVKCPQMFKFIFEPLQNSRVPHEWLRSSII